MRWNLEKIKNATLWILIASIPFGTKLPLHVFAAYKNEYVTAYLYATDLLAWIFLAVSALWLYKARVSLQRWEKIFLGGVLLVGVVMIVSSLHSAYVGLALYQSGKIVQWLLVGWVLAILAYRKETPFLVVASAVVCSAAFQALVALYQFFTRHSLGLRLLGEGALGINIGGSATFWAGSEKYLRAYGTTPHPNILAAFLFIALTLLCFRFFYLKKEAVRSGMFWGLEIVLGILSVAFMATFSRTAIVGGGFILIAVALWYAWRNRVWGAKVFFVSFLFFILLSSLIFWQPLTVRAVIHANEDAVTQRILYADVALRLIAQHPWLGVGEGAFTLAMQPVVQNMLGSFDVPNWLYQPVHDIYLLIWSEIGFMGFVSVAFLLGLTFWRNRRLFLVLANPYAVILMGLLAFALLDHFLWSLQIGREMLWCCVGLAAGSGSVGMENYSLKNK